MEAGLIRNNKLSIANFLQIRNGALRFYRHIFSVKLYYDDYLSISSTPNRITVHWSLVLRKFIIARPEISTGYSHEHIKWW